ncbi:response regulator transcription factor [Vulcaniibacterium tengchongense]|uniref:DNA-binding response OmpR family regulator n=1 Tax=Vulcaniibacterium tengchongense TaxID=1273429 RepID=A0A3N4VHI3_9GAMM|nr:response regulator transcription factor [Vulcaniibacterium tengchongense]RPE80975.1 DNA-binding response OmpR family regulator [Vulcaniibacterium tengchongense]
METEGALRVLLLEDDATLRQRVLLPGLANFGFAAFGVETAAALRERLKQGEFDVVVLDVGLPDGNGFDIACEIHAARPDLGIVMLTGRGETPDRVRGLSVGADAYLAKPVEIELLAATLHSLARRLRGAAPAAGPQGWHLGGNGWCLVSPAGRTVALTRTERRVVERLVRTPGQLVMRDQLIAALTDDVFDFDPHRLDSLLYRLRRKVADACGEPLPLVAVHGQGYVLGEAR